jgi:hypothetical protein
MDNSTTSTSTTLDQAAVALSGLCLVHCLVMPFAVILLPFLHQFGAEHFHVQMLALVLPISIIALALGFRRHRNFAVIGWGTFGMLLLTVGGTLIHTHYGLAADRIFTIAGALTLAVAHYFNTRLARRCRS